MFVAILFIISILEYIFYICCFKQYSHLLTIVFLIISFIPVLNIIVNSVSFIALLICANIDTYGDEAAKLKDTKFNRWLFNHLNWE